MGKKILITGSSGFVGGRVVKAMLQNGYEVYAPAHKEMDITSADSVLQYVDNIRPERILHLAAISDTGYCESHPEESYLVNVVGVENLAMAAARYDAKLVFFSSDQVYNGNHELGLLSEDVPVSPENHYGRHKLIAEQRALALSDSTVALRATWMYDDQVSGMRTHNNFVLNLKNAIREGKTILFATREFRGITWVEEVVRNIPDTFDLPGGVYNYGAENTLNTYETALKYAEMLVNNTGVIVADEKRFPEHIRNISISINKITEASDGKINFLTTMQGLAAFEDCLNIKKL